MTEAQEPYYTPTEAAPLIKGHPHFRTVIRKIKEKKLGAIQTNTGERVRYKIPQSAIDKYNKSLKFNLDE